MISRAGRADIRFWRFRSQTPVTRDPERMTGMVDTRFAEETHRRPAQVPAISRGEKAVHPRMIAAAIAARIDCIAASSVVQKTSSSGAAQPSHSHPPHQW